MPHIHEQYLYFLHVISYNLHSPWMVNDMIFTSPMNTCSSLPDENYGFLRNGQGGVVGQTGDCGDFRDFAREKPTPRLCDLSISGWRFYNFGPYRNCWWWLRVQNLCRITLKRSFKMWNFRQIVCVCVCMAHKTGLLWHRNNKNSCTRPAISTKVVSNNNHNNNIF